MADIFGQWKLDSLSVHLCHLGYSASTATQAYQQTAGIHGVYYTPLTTTEFTAATGLAAAIDFPMFAWASTSQPVRLDVKSKDITIPAKWLTTNSSGVTDLNEYQAGTVGLFAISPLAGALVSTKSFAVLDFVISFRCPMDPTLLPSMGNETVPRLELKRDMPVKSGNDEKSDDAEEKSEWIIPPTPSSRVQVCPSSGNVNIPLVRKSFARKA